MRPVALTQKKSSGWDQFTNQVIKKDLIFIVATDPANKSTTEKMTSLEFQIEKLTKLIKYQEVQSMNKIRYKGVTMVPRDDLIW